MAKEVKAIVLRVAGTNCDRETKYAFEAAGAEVELVHVNAVARGEKKLKDYHIMAVAGGFSYGDDISAGKVMANEMSRRIGGQMDGFVADGKLIIGICNGFQVLVKTGFLPGFAAAPGKSGADRQRVTVFNNDSGKFECRWIHLKLAEGTPCVFTRGLPPVISLPIAHGEGKLIFDSPETRKELWEKKLGVFQYVDEKGNPGPYPVNPNGAEDDLAGICNATGRVFGLMPHPERHIFKTQHPQWTRGGAPAVPHGILIFKNAVRFAKKEL